MMFINCFKSYGGKYWFILRNPVGWFLLIKAGTFFFRTTENNWTAVFLIVWFLICWSHVKRFLKIIQDYLQTWTELFVRTWFEFDWFIMPHYSLINDLLLMNGYRALGTDRERKLVARWLLWFRRERCVRWWNRHRWSPTWRRG